MKTSAGIILFRKEMDSIELLLGHMGGPFWSKKDVHAWTIPKGEFDINEESPADAARREFYEETGLEIRETLTPLSPYIKNNKKHYFFILEKTVEIQVLFSNEFEMEWPPRSGKLRKFPELDCFAWFDLDEARQKMVKGQVPALDLMMPYI